MNRRDLLKYPAMSLIGLCAPGWADDQDDYSAAGIRAIEVDDPHVIAEGMLIPGLIETPTQGPFVELVRRLLTVVSPAPIDVHVTSRLRLLRDVALSAIDWGFPMVRVPIPPSASTGYRLSTASIGQVSFVVFSRPQRILTTEAIQMALNEPVFPYKIIGPEIFELPFPVISLRNIESAVRMLIAGRCDALLAAQEDVDFALRRLNVSDMHRSFYKLYEDVFMLPLGPRGDFVDDLLTKAVNQLRETGELQKLYQRVHQRYDGPL